MVRTFIASLALVSFAIPAFAKPGSAAETFSRDGIDYVYTVTPAKHGGRIIRGTADGAPFRLVVSERTVRGTVDARPVAFTLAEVRARTERERLASR